MTDRKDAVKPPRSHVCAVRTNDDEFGAIRDAARRAGRPFARWVRETAVAAAIDGPEVVITVEGVEVFRGTQADAVRWLVNTTDADAPGHAN